MCGGEFVTRVLRVPAHTAAMDVLSILAGVGFFALLGLSIRAIDRI